MKLRQSLIVVADAKHGHVLVPHIRPPAVQVGQVRLTAPCDQSKVLAGRCPHAGRVAKVAEVGVPIQECQAVPSTAVERQRRAEHDAAVAAQHQREPPGI